MNKFDRFTPLYMTHAEVLMKIEVSNISKKPRPIKMPFRFQNKMKYC